MHLRQLPVADPPAAPPQEEGETAGSAGATETAEGDTAAKEELTDEAKEEASQEAKEEE